MKSIRPGGLVNARFNGMLKPGEAVAVEFEIPSGESLTPEAFWFIVGKSVGHIAVYVLGEDASGVGPGAVLWSSGVMPCPMSGGGRNWTSVLFSSGVGQRSYFAGRYFACIQFDTAENDGGATVGYAPSAPTLPPGIGFGVIGAPFPLPAAPVLNWGNHYTGPVIKIGPRNLGP